MESGKILQDTTAQLVPPGKQRNVFFVDTKRTCFLCLRELQPESLPIETVDLVEEERATEKGVERSKDFWGAMRKTDNPACKNRKFCLRSIHKYLKMNPGKVLSSNLSTSSLLASPAGGKLLNTDVSVLFCGNCEEMATHLTGLCLKMEVLEMNISHSLEKFAGALKNSDKDVTLNENFRSKLSNPMDFFHGSMAEILRKETQTKCYRLLEGSTPKVNLEGFRVTTCPNIPNTAPFTTTTSITTTSPKLIVPLLNEQTAKRLVTPARYKCKFCALAFWSTSGLRQHIRRNHRKNPASSLSTAPPAAALSLGCIACGSYFPSKADWIRHTRLYCSNRRGNNGNSVPGTITTTSATRTELVVEQPTPVIALDNKQNSVQEESMSTIPVNITMPTAVNISAMLKSLCQLKTVSNKLVCTLCTASDKNNKFTGEDELGKHIFARHAEYLFASVKLPTCRKKQFKEECERMIMNEIALSEKFIRLDDDSNLDKFTCLYCPSDFYQKRSIRAHIIQNHYHRLSAKLVEAQKNLAANTSTNFREEPFTIPVKLSNRIQKYKPEVLMRRRHKCVDCGEMFVQNSSLWRHRRLYCRYRQCNVENGNVGNSIASLNTETKSFDGKTRSKQKPVGGLGRYKCLDCGAGFAHSPSLWRHKKALNHMIGHDASLFRKKRKHLCKICGKGFTLPRYLDMHCKSTVCGKLGKETEKSGAALDVFTQSNAEPVNVSEPNIVVVSSYSLCSPAPSSATGTTPNVATAKSVKMNKNTVKCDYCEKYFSSSSVMRRHQRQNCMVAKAAAASKMYGASQPATEVILPNTEYFEGEEEQEIKVFQDSKVPVTDVRDVHPSSDKKQAGVRVDELILGDKNVTNVNFENESSSFIKSEDDQESKEMMIFPDLCGDPLEFYS